MPDGVPSEHIWWHHNTECGPTRGRDGRAPWACIGCGLDGLDGLVWQVAEPAGPRRRWWHRFTQRNR